MYGAGLTHGASTLWYLLPSSLTNASSCRQQRASGRGNATLTVSCGFPAGERGKWYLAGVRVASGLRGLHQQRLTGSTAAQSMRVSVMVC
jgi:hypothetical protein